MTMTPVTRLSGGLAISWPTSLVLGFAIALLLPTKGFAFVSTGNSGYSQATKSAPSSHHELHVAANLPDSVIDTIHRGGIAQVDNFLSPAEIRTLRSDAHSLFDDGHFITDALANYGQSKGQKDKAQFDVSKDRSVCPSYIPSKASLGPFVNDQLGNNSQARRDLTATMTTLRKELAVGLDRPGMAALPDGMYNHELSYTRFGPGAFLKRHVDEHHEELKGVRGWSAPTRRSLSWLVYLNEPDWNAKRDGGCLRTYPRVSKQVGKVGACHGDLQIGWLAPTRQDPVERPVFLDGRRQGEAGNCAMYTIGMDNKPTYLTENFSADPYLFLSTGDWVVQHVLIQNPAVGDRFHYLEPPKSKLTDFMDTNLKANTASTVGEGILDVAPTGGTLVMFDSVALPHEVLATLDRERWAISGWFHEAQQELPPAKQQQQRNQQQTQNTAV
ncbi:oxygenase [Seminavis robusta]|uniref:Oxygenase n=1 Tax=Seminavis robusta TaxID=568900 RepID=A0A9N8HUS9_9STRA|nr:oxygenase [Seminavis robusta]|eukprot:Sro1424_g271450.1 oxygenase (443) ;mRNA; r:9932-11260